VPLAEAERLSARAAVALAARDWDAAASAANAAVAADPAAWEAHRTLTQAELGRGDPAAALAAADRLLAAWPDDGPALYLRGLALQRLGRSAEARAALDLARQRLASSPVYQARIAQANQDPHGTPSDGDPSLPTAPAGAAVPREPALRTTARPLAAK
jgi:tetratricopeptide (TPR) repeat protein